jgi:MoxR-like ATPase
MIEQLIQHLNKNIVGNEDKVQLALASILAGGSILLEDNPGTGKTTFAKLIAENLNLDFKRIQFTSDMLPSDINGFTKYINNQPHLQKGPIFSNMILADELNRGNPKCQSAFMESMEEKSVTIDGTTHKLPHPFFVMATQNPSDQIGTYPLPESQLDRFMISFSMNQLSSKQEKDILMNHFNVHSNKPDKINLEELMKKASLVQCNDLVIEYIQNLKKQASAMKFDVLLSTRTLLFTVQISKAYAFLQNKDYVTFDEVQKIFPYVLRHRVKSFDSNVDLVSYIQKEVIEKVVLPR